MPSFAGKTVAENIIVTELKKREKDEMVGKEYVGTVKNIADFGVFVRIEGGTDGLLHKSKIPKSFGDFKEHFKQGDTVKVKVTDVSEKGISLGLV
jgi:ribosomal protein S1